MIFQTELHNRRLRCDSTKAVSIGIPMQFDGPQPNHFGLPPAHATPFQADGFIGDTRRGGSCNVAVVSLAPHCNGTHTECVGHIVSDPVLISDHAPEPFLLATLCSLSFTRADETSESYRPKLHRDDQVITAEALDIAVARDGFEGSALIIRTTPNPVEKRFWKYGNDRLPGFFTCEAMEWITSHGFQHLLVDLPSIDRMFDDGRLTNHHLFWDVAEESHHLTECSRTDRTITELIYVPDQLPDGDYLLNLQLAPFASDAAPSRPVLIPIEYE